MSEHCTATTGRTTWSHRSPRPTQQPPRRSERRSDHLSVAEIAALVIVVALLLAAPVVSRSTPPGDTATTMLRVEQGDTVWMIAAAHPVSGLNTAQNADLIARLNDLDAGRLAAGTTLRVPSAADSASVALR